jgi:hypothetical protein
MRQIVDADRPSGGVDMSYDLELAGYEALVRQGHKLDAIGFPGREYDFLRPIANATPNPVKSH